ncbi:MAG: SDR family NAD(P)-dependent oxidoreductase [bacterium]
MDINEKNIIVTGGAGGIGFCIIQSLLKKNAVVAAVDLDQDKLNDLENKCLSLPGKVFCYCGDVGDINFAEFVTNDFFNRRGQIDALVNNAAILKDAPLASIFKGKINKFPIEVWDETISSNLRGVFCFGREVAEKMISKRTRGVIINVSSISATGNIGQSAYAAAKAGVNALTVTWASELSHFGIRVAGIAPGMTDTDMPKNSMNQSAILEWVKKTPVRRMGFPEEIADGINFILQNDFFCGRVLEIDGGLRM